MPAVAEDLNEGLDLQEDENGRLSLTRTFFCTDLTGATPVEKFAQALTLTAGGTAHTGGDVPAAFSFIIVNGKKLYVKSRRLEPFPPADATVYVAYGEANLTAAGYGPTIIECGSTCEQNETEFDAVERAKPFAQRNPIQLLWDKNNTTPGANAKKSTPRIPIYTGKSVKVFRRQQTIDPSSYADQFVARTNSGGWKGYSADQALCLSITGVNQNSGAGLWDTIHEFAIDKEGLHRSIVRAIDEDTGLPVFVDQARIAASNGIKEVVGQFRADFNSLAL
jgi:hypothetical protein